MSWSKEDISFKKLSSKRVTWTSNQVFEEIGARSLDIHNLDIKADPIPDVPPGTSTSVLQFYNYSAGTGLTLVKDLTVSDNLTYFATIFNGSGQEAFANQLVGAGATGRLFNFVSDKYDALGTAAGTVSKYGRAAVGAVSSFFQNAAKQAVEKIKAEQDG